MKRSYTFVREGCATNDPDCPNGDEAITVLYDGQRLTSCIRRPEEEKS